MATSEKVGQAGYGFREHLVERSARDAGEDPANIQNIHTASHTSPGGEECIYYEVSRPFPLSSSEYRLCKNGDEWQLAYKPSGLLIPIIGTFFSAGCGGWSDINHSYKDGGPLGCTVVATPEINSDELTYTDGRHYVVADQLVDPEVAKIYLDELPHYIDKILDFYGTSSPWKDSIVLYMRDINKYDPYTPINAGWGCIWVYNGSGFPFTSFKDPLLCENFFGYGPFIEELRHALLARYIGLPRFVEEGAANYTVKYLDQKEVPAPEPAKSVFDGQVNVGECLHFDDEMSEFLKEFIIKSINGNKIKFKYKLKKPTKEYPELNLNVYTDTEMKIGERRKLIDTLVEVVPFDSEAARVKIYKRGESDDSSYIHSQQKAPLCLENGFYNSADAILTDEGWVILNTEDKFEPYVPFGFWTNFCFWDRIREMGGHADVQEIYRAMEKAAIANSHAEAPFPFYETVKTTLGLSERDAREFFESHYVPVEDGYYQPGGYCSF